MILNKSAEEFISRHAQWREVLLGLRGILLSTELEETIKWGIPVYTLNGKNVVGLAAFQNHVALWFFQGALLKDSRGLLINAQKGKTRAQRQMRFDTQQEIAGDIVLEYIEEAMRNQKQGKVLKGAKKEAFQVPTEMTEAFVRIDSLKSSFKLLAPYKQREYVEFISEAKRAETRARRMEKIAPMIIDGKGLNEKYRS